MRKSRREGRRWTHVRTGVRRRSGLFCRRSTADPRTHNAPFPSSSTSRTGRTRDGSGRRSRRLVDADPATGRFHRSQPLLPTHNPPCHRLGDHQRIPQGAGSDRTARSCWPILAPIPGNAQRRRRQARQQRSGRGPLSATRPPGAIRDNGTLFLIGPYAAFGRGQEIFPVG
jgi:hypothetical protein